VYHASAALAERIAGPEDVAGAGAGSGGGNPVRGVKWRVEAADDFCEPPPAT